MDLSICFPGMIKIYDRLFEFLAVFLLFLRSHFFIPPVFLFLSFIVLLFLLLVYFFYIHPPSKYSIKFAEEQAAKQKQEYLDQIWEENKDNLTCDKNTFIAEYEEFTKDLKPEEISEKEFIIYITDKYGKPEEPKDTGSSESTNNNGGGNSSNNNGGGSSNNNGGGSNNNGGGSSNNNGGGSSNGGGGSNNNGGGSSNNGGGSSNNDGGGSNNNGGGSNDNGNGGGFSDNGTGGNDSGNNGGGTVDIPPGFVWDDDAVVDVVD